MRTVTLAIFLVVALHGIASASVAFASTSEATAARPQQELNAGPVGFQQSRSAPLLKAEAETKPQRSAGNIVGRDVPQPKPVQIYWFFGGR
jgi:hypothetical protein